MVDARIPNRLRGLPAAAALAALLPVALPAHAAITNSRIETTAEVNYSNSRDGTLSEFIRSIDIGSFTSLTRPIFTAPSGAPFDTFGEPARLAASQSVLGFNSVAVQGAFSNGVRNDLFAQTVFAQSVEAEEGDAARVSFNVFPAQIGITCYSTFAPATIADIADVCHPSIGSAAEVSLEFAITRLSLSQPSIGFDSVTAGLRLEVLADANDPSRSVVAVTQLGSTALTYTLALEGTGGFAPLLVLNIDPFSGVLDAGIVDAGSAFLSLDYTMHASIHVEGSETGASARIADPFALEADPVAYFHSQFPGSPLPGFNLGSGGGGSDVPAPATVAAGVVALLAVRRRRAAQGEVNAPRRSGRHANAAAWWHSPAPSARA